jgi:tetratricopeptide (TPR) repeat protein
MKRKSHISYGVFVGLMTMLACGCSASRLMGLYANTDPTLGSALNPVQVCGPGLAQLYISSLRCADQSAPIRGETMAKNALVSAERRIHENHTVHVFRIPCRSGAVEIHIDPYHCMKEMCESFAGTSDNQWLKNDFLPVAWCDGHMTVQSPVGMEPFLDLSKRDVQRRVANQLQRPPPSWPDHSDPMSAVEERFEALADDATVEALLTMGQAYVKRGEVQHLEGVLKEALPAVKSLQDPAIQSVSLAVLSRLFNAAGRTDEATQYLKQAIETAAGVSDLALRAHALTTVGHALADLGERDEAHRALDGARRLLKVSSGRSTQVITAVALARAYSATGRHGTANNILTGAADMAGANPAPLVAARNLGAILRAHAHRGDHATGIEVARLLPNAFYRAGALIMLARDLVLFDRTTKVPHVVRACLQEVKTLEAKVDKALILSGLAEVAGGAGYHEVAARMAKRAVALSYGLGESQERIELLVQAAKVCADASYTEDALEYVHYAMKMAQKADVASDRTQLLTQVATGYVHSGSDEEVDRVLTAALSAANEIGSRIPRAQAIARVGLVHAMKLDHGTAIKLASEVKNTRIRAEYLTEIGIAYVRAGHIQLGVDALRRAVLDAIAMESEEPRLNTLVRIAVGFAWANRPAEAMDTARTIREP